MVSALKEHKVPYYTYENKQTRPIRVVAKGLHHMWSEEEIHNDLLAKGYKIEHVSKQLSAKDFTTPYFELDRFLESERAPEKEINLHHAGQVDTLMTTSNSANPDPATAPGTRDTLPLLKSLFELFKQQK
ncbi:hypothetical protein M8J77_005127 [Diaphorina citri]|nr:hypothetical protein M8J77_005127 [Diaphorina citri]